MTGRRPASYAELAAAAPGEEPVFYLGTGMPHWLWSGAVQVPLFPSHTRLCAYVTLRRSTTSWALDSGGFTELQRYGSWDRVPPRQYVEAVLRYDTEIGNLDWAAPQDWMCEPAIIHGGTFNGIRFAGRQAPQERGQLSAVRPRLARPRTGSHPRRRRDSRTTSPGGVVTFAPTADPQPQRVECPPAIREFLERLDRHWMPTRAQADAVRVEIAALLADRADLAALRDTQRRAGIEAAALELARINSHGQGSGPAPADAIRELVDAICPLAGIAARRTDADWVDEAVVDRAVKGEDAGRPLTPAERAAATEVLRARGRGPTAIADLLRIQSYNEQVRRRVAEAA